MRLLARFTVLGNPQTKANSRKVITVPGKNGTGRLAIAKSDGALAYAGAVHSQVPARLRTRHDGPILVIATLYYQSRRSDLTLDLIQDALQDFYKTEYGQRFLVWEGVFQNDRQIFNLVMRKKIDPKNPRADISVYALPVANKQGDPGGPWTDLDHDTWAAALLGAIEGEDAAVSVLFGSLSY